MFDVTRRTVTIDGQDVVLAELSAGDFVTINAEEDDTQSGFLLLMLSIESPKVTAEDVAKWPNRVVNELLAVVFDLNGLNADPN